MHRSIITFVFVSASSIADRLCTYAFRIPSSDSIDRLHLARSSELHVGEDVYYGVVMAGSEIRLEV